MNSAKRYQFLGSDKRLMNKALYTLVEAAAAVGIHEKTLFSRMNTKINEPKYNKIITD